MHTTISSIHLSPIFPFVASQNTLILSLPHPCFVSKTYSESHAISKCPSPAPHTEPYTLDGSDPQFVRDPLLLAYGDKCPLAHELWFPWDIPVGTGWATVAPPCPYSLGSFSVGMSLWEAGHSLTMPWEQLSQGVIGIPYLLLLLVAPFCVEISFLSHQLTMGPILKLSKMVEERGHSCELWIRI